MDQDAAAILTEFGARVRDRRREREWTQEELAERARLHRTYITGVERGDRNVTLMTLVSIADALSLDPAELVRGLTRQR